MKLLIVGSGGREHAIIDKLLENKQIEHIYAIPGNGGIAAVAQCVQIRPTDIEAIRDFAVEKQVNFAVVAPDDPLILGAVDLLEEAGIPCFGPNKKAAVIEGSKIFSKELMLKYQIPTADYKVFDTARDALEFCAAAERYPLVIKADGPALGKGVLIAETELQASDSIHNIMEKQIFGKSGSRVVIEEFLTGPEISVLAFTDGKTIVPMISSMDHKRALDGDMGLNTGGMGVIAPNPYYTEEIAAECMQRIYLPTIEAMRLEGRKFKGCLYFGLMLTKLGPKVIEYNCRFGDPEAQAVLPLLKSDLFTVMRAVAEEHLHEIELEFKDESACCVVLASGGYPEDYETGYPVKFGNVAGAKIYHAGTRLTDGRLYTSGGRVLGVTAVAPTLKEAVGKAYLSAAQVHFERMHYRRDIGQRALSCVDAPCT